MSGHEALIGRLERRALTLRVVGVISLACALGLVGGILYTLFFVESAVTQDQALDVRSIQQQIDEIKSSVATFQGSLSKVTAADSAGQASLKLAEFRASRLQDELSKVDPASLQTRFFISLFVTRLTVVLVLLFITNFFINLFRYAVRLAAFLDSRADVLRGLGTVTLTMAELQTLLANDRIDFHGPRSPDKQAVDLAKSLLALKDKPEAK
jgi:predicted PurR-regulated permease PerM